MTLRVVAPFLPDLICRNATIIQSSNVYISTSYMTHFNLKNTTDGEIAEAIKLAIRNIPDFPKPGIQFKDITTALKNPEALHLMADTLYEYYKNKGITKVVGVESRGFVIGSILAYKLNAGFVLLRKPGKLPAQTYRIDYELEYGADGLEIHKDAISPDDVLLLHDDLLATGGSANASLQLLRKFGDNPIYASFLIELLDLEGVTRLGEAIDVYSLVQY